MNDQYEECGWTSEKRASEVPTKLESFLLSRDTCLFYCLLVIRFM